MKRKSGFTLVELVVVVLILGIIASVAVPRVIRSTVSAGESALKQDLDAIRGSIDLYAQDHNGNFPSGVGDGTNAAGSELAFKNQLLQYSNAAGGVSTTKGAAFPYGPYLRNPFPKSPVGTQTDAVTVVTAGAALAGANATGWRYDNQTGEFICDATGTASDGVTTYDNL